MMTNAPLWNIAALARAWRMDESLRNHHTGADADRVVAISRHYLPARNGRKAVRVVITDCGREWLATKGFDGRWWPVSCLDHLPPSARYREVA